MPPRSIVWIADLVISLFGRALALSMSLLWREPNALRDAPFARLVVSAAELFGSVWDKGCLGAPEAAVDAAEQSRYLLRWRCRSRCRGGT